MYIWGDGQHGKLGIGNSVGNMFLPQHVRKFTKFDVWRVIAFTILLTSSVFSGVLL